MKKLCLFCKSELPNTHIKYCSHTCQFTLMNAKRVGPIKYDRNSYLRRKDRLMARRLEYKNAFILDLSKIETD